MHKLEQFGIGTQIHYTPIFLQPYYIDLASNKFPNTLKYYDSTLSLPLYPDLKDRDIKLICKKLLNILDK